MAYGRREDQHERGSGGSGEPGGQGEGEEAIGQAPKGDRAGSSKGSMGFVYFLETEDAQYVKIGYSKEVYVRISQLGTLRPGSFRLRLIGSVRGTPAIEKWLHVLFADDRDSGEWFRNSNRLRTLIELLHLIPPETRAERPKRTEQRNQINRPLQVEPEEVEVDDVPINCDAMAIQQLKCLRCGHEWEKRTPDRPVQCPRCKQPRWDEPSKWAGPRRRPRKAQVGTEGGKR